MIKRDITVVVSIPETANELAAMLMPNDMAALRMKLVLRELGWQVRQSVREAVTEVNEKVNEDHTFRY